MLDLSNMKTPTAADNTPVQAKFTISSSARDKLREASAQSGHDMSTILELLIMTQLAVGGMPTNDAEQPEGDNYELDF